MVTAMQTHTDPDVKHICAVGSGGAQGGSDANGGGRSLAACRQPVPQRPQVLLERHCPGGRRQWLQQRRSHTRAHQRRCAMLVDDTLLQGVEGVTDHPLLRTTFHAHAVTLFAHS